MQEVYDLTKPLGGIVAIIEHKDKPKQIFRFPNTVLTRGRMTLAKFLVEPQPDAYVANMLFGDGGWDYQQGSKKTVDSEKNSLFGVTRANKPVVAQIDPAVPTQAIFTSVLTYQDANDFTLNEMALRLSNGDLFSMATFPNLGKTDQMQITWVWSCSFV